jgi:hypothetical protein
MLSLELPVGQCDDAKSSLFSALGGRLAVHRADTAVTIASQFSFVPLVSFRLQITKSEITADGSR